MSPRRKPRPYHRTGGSARNPASLSNLRPFTPDGRVGVGNQRGLKHGWRSELLVRDVEREIRELMNALAEQAPVRDPDGGLPGADIVAVEAAARALKRWRSVSHWCDLHGRLDDDGEVRPAARYELEGESALHRCLDVLGMNPTSRAKLGLDLVRAQRTLGDELAEGRAAWEQREAIDGEADDASA